MSIKVRSILGALLFFGGLLLLVGAGVYKSSDRMRFEHNSQRQEGDRTPPARTGPNLLMMLGGLVSAGGVVVIVLAARHMVDQIGSASAQAEQRLQRELTDPKAPKAKPPT